MKFLLLLVAIAACCSEDKASASYNETCSKGSRCDNKLSVRRLADLLSSKFHEVVTNELGSEYTFHLEPRTPHRVTRTRSTDQEVIKRIAEKLAYKLSSATTILRDMNSVLVSNNNTPSFMHPCPFTSIRKSVFVKNPNVYDFTPSQAKAKLLGRFKDVKVKRQYFLSHIDYATDRDCSATSLSNLRNLYHRIVHPDPKIIVFILDNTIGADSFQYAVNIVLETANALQTSDMIALKITNSSDFIKFEDACSDNEMSDVGNATDNNKILLREYLVSMDTSQSSFCATNISHELNLLLEKPNLPNNKLVIFLTDTKLQKNETWLKTFILTKQKHVHFAIGAILQSGDRNSSLEILHFDKWHNHGSNHTIVKIHMYDRSVVGQVASAIISLIPTRYSKNEIIAESPIWEATGRDFLIPVVLPTQHGVLGLDLYWSDLAEDIVYFQGNDYRKRAFVMDFSGTVLMHSFFPRPELASEKIKFTNLDAIESFDFISDVKEQMTLQSSGNFTVFIESTNKSIVYSWEWVEKLYIVCIVSEMENRPALDKTNVYLSWGNREILFHRLDLFPPKNGKMCRHFKQVATIDQGTVYLSPSSFQSPFSYLYDMSDGQEAVTYMQNYLAYLRSVAHGLLSNPGLKTEIQHDVAFLNAILSYYKNQHLHGAYSKYVVRRYAVTEAGVMVMFPGTVLEYDYEPLRRPWYTYAFDNPGKIILTPPNLDVGGAGYVVSISYAVKHQHYPPMVVSMDVTMGFLYKLLIDSLSLCALPYVKCFIMNNRGYLVSHPGLMDPNSSGPIEQQHITHKESMIAIDMLNHNGFVRKRLCNNFSDKTIQRFYEFNTSLSNVLSNVVSGDHCIHYYIAAIPGTNAFIGLVNASCSVGAFCPCSTVDRLCLNCNRMEQNECECPCECSSEAFACQTNVTRNHRDVSLCGVIPESNHHKSHYFNNFAENLKPCFDFQCELYTTHSSCLGVMGCEWCQLDTDGRTRLSTPFCTPQSTCFNGVLGAVTPYGEGTYEHVMRDDVLGAYSAIGPIAGCIVTVSLVIAVAIYCYRQNVTSASCHNLYVDGPAETWPEQDVQLSHLQSEDAHGDHSGHDKLLPAAEIDAPISPYRVVTGYRRPHTTGDSDHGYSTMTPHEDSEATAFSVNEPIVLSDDTKSDVSCPISTRIKPRPRPGDTCFTTVPCSKNSIIAPVTVHKHMEAS